MTKLALTDINKIMRDIDICMLATKTAAGKLESRPMSNNRQVDYDGDSYFFADGGCSAAQEIAADSEVNLSFIHSQGLFSKSIYLSITGQAQVIRDRAVLKEHWVKDVEVWFKDGIETPGLVLIRVKASRIKYWHGTEEGEITL